MIFSLCPRPLLSIDPSPVDADAGRGVHSPNNGDVVSLLIYNPATLLRVHSVTLHHGDHAHLADSVRLVFPSVSGTLRQPAHTEPLFVANLCCRVFGCQKNLLPGLNPRQMRMNGMVLREHGGTVEIDIAQPQHSNCWNDEALALGTYLRLLLRSRRRPQPETVRWLWPNALLKITK